MGNYDRIAKKLNSAQTVILNGGIGTEVLRRGVRWRWYGLKTDAKTVEGVHRDYVAAGADVITTNTFGLTKRLYLNVFHDLEHMRRIGAPDLETRARDLTKIAVDVARNAVREGGNQAVVAGSIGPIQHPYRPDMAPKYDRALAEHRETAKILAEFGVDMILIEGMNTIEEAAAAAEAAKGTGLPFWVSFIPDDKGNVLSGEKISDAVKRVEPIGPAAFLITCAPPEDVTLALKQLKAATNLPVGGYAQIGFFDPPSWKFEFHPQFTGMDNWPPEKYAGVAKQWRAIGASILGGSHGTGPEHISAIRKQVN